MVSGPEVDFSSFLDFGDLQLNFQNFDGNTQDQEENQGASGEIGMDLQTSHTAVGAMDFSHGNMPQFTTPAVMGNLNGDPNLFADSNIPSQRHDQQRQTQQVQQPPSYGQQYMPLNMIPQTPNSIEMHGGQAQYQHASYQNHNRATHEYYQYQSKGQVRP